MNADIDVLTLDGSAVFDFDRVLNEVINSLKNDARRSTRWLKKVPVTLKAAPAISENTRNILKKEFRSVTNEA